MKNTPFEKNIATHKIDESLAMFRL